MLKDTIMAYVKEISDGKGAEVDEQTDLFEEHILESLEIISLLSYLQDEFNISFSAEDLDFANFQTVDKIVDWVNNKGNRMN